MITHKQWDNFIAALKVMKGNHTLKYKGEKIIKIDDDGFYTDPLKEHATTDASGKTVYEHVRHHFTFPSLVHYYQHENRYFTLADLYDRVTFTVTLRQAKAYHVDEKWVIKFE
jgi:hypothetical protein